MRHGRDRKLWRSALPALEILAAEADDAPLRLAVERNLLGDWADTLDRDSLPRSPRAAVTPVLFEPLLAWAAACEDRRPWRRLVDLHDAVLGVRGRPAGAVYTPSALAKMVAATTAAHLGAKLAEATFLEPGCGAGAMLCELAELLGELGLGPHQIVERLRGIELDPGAASVARRALSVAVTVSAGPPPWSEIRGAITVGDLLTAEALGDRFTAVVGNPPYAFGAALGERDRAAVAARYELARGGQVDLFRVFYEATVEQVEVGGVHTFIVPDVIVARDELADLRAWIAARASIEEVVLCGRAFASPESSGSLAVGAAVVVLRSGAEQGPVKVARWSEETGLTERRDSPGHGFGREGRPWPVGGSARWPELRATLVAPGLTVSDLLVPGPAGSTRGEELGSRALGPLDAPDGVPIIRGADVVRLGSVGATRTVPVSSLSKPGRFYRGPKVVVVKTGSTVVASVDDTDRPTLQSVYVLHLHDEGPWCPWSLAGLLSSAWLGVYALNEWTAVRSVHPQLTLGNLRGLPVPDASEAVISSLARLTRQLCGLPADDLERRRLERRLDEMVGLAFGVELEPIARHLSEILASLPRNQRPSWIDRSGRGPNLR